MLNHLKLKLSRAIYNCNVLIPAKLTFFNSHAYVIIIQSCHASHVKFLLSVRPIKKKVY